MKFGPALGAVGAPVAHARAGAHDHAVAAFSLYLHIPYCDSKCPYCDFNSYAAKRWPERAYADALIAELRAAAPRPEWRDRTLRTIFFGGGTPSLFAPATIAGLLAAARDLWPDRGARHRDHARGQPGDRRCRQAARTSRAAGVNRISFGVQSFHARPPDDARAHPQRRRRRSTRSGAARAAGFANLNLDLIFAVPGQTLDEWEADLRDGDGPRAGPHLGLRPDLRRGHGLSCPAAQRRADAAARGGRGGDVHAHARGCSARTATRRTRSRTSRVPVAPARTTSTTGAPAPTSASAPGRTRSPTRRRRADAGATRSRPCATSSAPRRAATRAPVEELLDASAGARRVRLPRPALQRRLRRRRLRGSLRHRSRARLPARSTAFGRDGLLASRRRPLAPHRPRAAAGGLGVRDVPVKEACAGEPVRDVQASDWRPTSAHRRTVRPAIPSSAPAPARAAASRGCRSAAGARGRRR